MTQKHPVRRERELRGWSQAKLAELLGTTPLSISQWERRIAIPSPHFREQLCILFGKNADELGLLAETKQKQNVQKSGIVDPMIPRLSPESKTLVGRETLVSQLVTRCTTSSTTVLYGLPGVGKTALLCVLAQHATVREAFQDGILWAALGPDAHVVDHLSRWSRLLGVPTAELERVQQLEDLVKLLRIAIGQRRLLLLLDDVWSLEDVSPFLSMSGANCICVFTTRSPLLAVQITGQESALRVSELSEEEGLALLTRFVPALVEQETDAICSLLTQAGTLPLSLLLVGKYLQSQSYAKQPRRIQKALLSLNNAEQRLAIGIPRPLIDTSSNSMIDIPLSLKSVIALSDHRLSQAGQDALRTLSVLPAKPSSFSERVAGALLAQNMDALDELSDAGLIESSEVQRYSMHQTIADYARCDLRDDLFLRLVEVGLHYLKAHAKDYSALEREHDMLVEVMDAAHRLNRWQALIQGCLVLVPFLQTQHEYLLATKYLEWGYEAAEQEGDDETMQTVLLQLGMAKEREGAYGEGEQYLYSGLSLARRRKSKEQIAFLTRLGSIAIDRSQFVEADAFFQEAISLASLENDVNALCVLLTFCGQLGIKQDDLEQADQYAQRGFALLSIVTNDAERCSFLRFVGLLYLLHGEYEQAQQILQEGLEVARRVGNEVLLSLILRNLGRLAYLQGRFIQAEMYYREALVYAEQADSFKHLALLQTSLGVLAMHLGRDEQAQVYIQEALVRGQQLRNPELIAVSLMNLGDLAYERHDYEQAEKIYQEALAYMQQEGTPKYFLCGAFCQLSMTKLKQSEMSQAKSYLQEGMKVVKEVDSFKAWSLAYEAQGEYALVIQDVQQAAESFENMRRRAPKEDILLLSTAQYGFARVAAVQGQQHEAVKLGRRVLQSWREMGYRRAKEVEEWLQTLSFSLIEKV